MPGLGGRPGTPTGRSRGGEAPGRAGDRRAGAVRRSAVPAPLQTRGSGPARREHGSRSPGPGVRPSGRRKSSGEPWDGRASDGAEPAALTSGDPCVRVPAGTPAPGLDSLSLPGPRRPCPGESEAPPEPAPFLGSWQPVTLGLGRCQFTSYSRSSVSMRDPSVQAPQPYTQERGASQSSRVS